MPIIFYDIVNKTYKYANNFNNRLKITKYAYSDNINIVL